MSLTAPVAYLLQAPTADNFHSRVPVRIRVEARNSLNNRFVPDSRIRTQAVLSLDDDIFMPCSDIGALRRHAAQ
jgi:Glycosyl transferase family 64 domain